MEITLTELERAINYWRQLRPATGEECALSVEVNALASVYALMIFHGIGTQPLERIALPAQQLLAVWRSELANQ